MYSWWTSAGPREPPESETRQKLSPHLVSARVAGFLLLRHFLRLRIFAFVPRPLCRFRSRLQTVSAILPATRFLFGDLPPRRPLRAPRRARRRRTLFAQHLRIVGDQFGAVARSAGYSQGQSDVRSHTVPTRFRGGTQRDESLGTRIRTRKRRGSCAKVVISRTRRRTSSIARPERRSILARMNGSSKAPNSGCKSFCRCSISTSSSRTRIATATSTKATRRSRR